MALVRVERREHVATVTLARPDQRNAISIAMLEELTKALGELAADPEARVVVLAGEGKDFCAGADFDDLTIMNPPGHDFGRSFEDAIHAITSCPVPVLARVQGAALGAGCQLVVACDMAIAAAGARIGIPAARLGILISFENIERLVLSVGPKRAADIMYTGRIVSGVEAAAWGLINEAVDADQLESRTEEVADAVAGGAPLTVKGSKRGIGAVLEKLSVDRATEAHRVAEFDELALEAFGSEDLQEGIRAFRDRRPPRFGGA